MNLVARTQQVKQASLLLLGGGVGAVAALTVSRISSGFLEAGAYLLAITIAAVSFGVAAELVSSVVLGGVPCGSCADRKTRLDEVWVCPRCDRIAV